MGEAVVVLGSGYAGAGAIRRLESALDGEADVTWVSDVPYHLVLHEAHRCIRDPDVSEKIAVPVDEVTGAATTFRRGTVVDVRSDDRAVDLADGRTVAYDYLLVAIGSRTAFFGIDGLEKHAHTLKSLDDALGIHDALVEAAAAASPADRARVVVGGAGLSGVQAAGEVAAFRDGRDAAVDVTLVEGLDAVLPDRDPRLQAAVRRRLEARDVDVRTGEFVGAVDADRVHVGDDSLAYDVLVWTGGITGREAVRNSDLDRDERNHRIHADRTFETDDDRVFAVGDCALVDQPGGGPAPATAQAAWQAADVAGRNLARRVRGRPLVEWTHDDKGTVVSVGDAAVAHDVAGVPVVTFGGTPARLLKKAIAVRWIASIAGVRRALDAWPDM